ncbi:uncharacterized protein TNCV_1236391 [Trichonephila clavipes]|nr:uncharacterized protein TNCV_1236391 [Trichonephila clavipes]
MEQKYDVYGRAFMSKYVSKENGWTLTPDAWFDMVMNPFFHKFPMLKVHTHNTSIHIWTTRADYERLWCPERFSTVAYLIMKRVRNPRTEGRRIFRNLMDLPPLDNIEVASHSTQVNHMDRVDDSSEASENRSLVASDNTTSDEDSSNNADNEVLDSMSSNNADNEILDGMFSNNADNVTSNNIEVDTLHASDSMDDSSSDGVLETSTNIQASLDILHADASDDMQSSSDNMASDSLHGTSDDMASDSLHGTSDDMASDTMASDNMVQIKGETNLHKGKLIWVGRNMQTPSRIRVVPPVRIDMAKKKLIWVKRKLKMINKN